MSEAIGTAPAGRTLTGYVEAITDTAALGWVWRPGHPDRVSVALRLGDQTIATAQADGLRPDLAQNGIGDGRHAFNLPIAEAWRARLSELRVFATDADGSSVPLDLPVPANAPAGPGHHQLQRGIDALIASQRVLHRNLQSALLQRNEAPTAALAEIERAQAKLGESMATLELFVTRIEQSLALSLVQPEREPARKRGLAVAMGLSTLSFVASAVALGWVMWSS